MYVADVAQMWHCCGCGVRCRRGSDVALLWLWRRLAATAPIRPLAWEAPYAMGAAQERAKKKKEASMCLAEYHPSNVVAPDWTVHIFLPFS